MISNFLIDMHFDFDGAIVEFFNKLCESDFLKAIFKGITFLGTEYLVIVLFGLLYWCVDKKFAKEIGLSAFFAMQTNGLFKGIVNRPRPFQQYPTRIHCYDESILLKDINGNFIETDYGYGLTLRSSSTSFPSGHSQNASSVFNAIGFGVKKKWLFVILQVLCILVMISRMALGVHFFTDVLVGYLLGIISILGYKTLMNKSKNQNKVNIILLIIFGILTLIWPIFSKESRDLFTMYGVIVGLVFGFMVEEKKVNFEMTKEPIKIILRFIIGIAIAIGIKVLFKLTYSWAFEEGTYICNVFDMIRYFLMAFIPCGIYPMLFKKFKF